MRDDIDPDPARRPPEGDHEVMGLIVGKVVSSRRLLWGETNVYLFPSTIGVFAYDQAGIF